MSIAVSIAAGPFAIAAVLLALGGASKAVSPSDTATALGGMGVRVPSWAVRVGGAAEAALGVVALLTGEWLPAALVAVSYLGFALFVLVALRRDAPLSTCGCFGGVDTPPSVVHVAINVGAAAAALAIVAQPGAGLARVLESQPLAGVPYALLVVVGVYLAFVAVTALPRTLAAARLVRGA